MDAILCDHCKTTIDHKARYFDLSIKFMEYLRVPDALGYMTSSENNRLATTRLHLCADCGNKILHGCRW